MRLWTALGVITAIVAAAAIVTIRTAELGRADVCADQSGQQFEAVGAQAWDEVASFVNQFASGWRSSFRSQFPFM
jgi:hypothetical protein